MIRCSVSRRYSLVRIEAVAMVSHFFRVIGAQGFEPGEPLLVRHPDGDILSPLDLVAFPLQPDKQFV